MVLEGSVGGRSSIPCAATMYNCVLWALYGSVSPDGSELVVLTNIFGACCMFYCLLKFLRYSEDVEQFGQILIFPAVATPLVIVLTAFYFSDMGANLLFLGWVCALSRGLVGVLPLVMNLRTVYLQGAALNTGSLLLSSTGLLTSAVWTAFACTGTQSNGFIFWPSLVALVSAGLQVVLHIVLMLAH